MNEQEENHEQTNWYLRAKADHGFTDTEVVKRCKVGKNQPAKWKTQKDDSQLQQDTVLKLIKGIPEIKWEDYLPIYKEIIEQTRKNARRKRKNLPK